jgi:hypothetical protein
MKDKYLGHFILGMIFMITAPPILFEIFLITAVITFLHENSNQIHFNDH